MMKKQTQTINFNFFIIIIRVISFNAHWKFLRLGIFGMDSLGVNV